MIPIALHTLLVSWTGAAELLVYSNRDRQQSGGSMVIYDELKAVSDPAHER